MAVSESARNDLYNGLRDLLGPDRAETLMTYLPVFDPSEIATKSDLRELRHYVDQRFDAVDQRFEAVDRRFDTLDRKIDTLGRRIDRVLLTLAAGLFVIFAAVLGVLGVVVAAIT